LQILDFAYLQPKTKTFLEVLLVTVFQDLEKKAAKSGIDSEKSIVDIFAKAKEAPQMLVGLQYFLSNNVKPSFLALSGTEKAALKRACRTALDTLTLVSA
jgi:nucleolar MIF4G domain-containing protein 1